MENEHGPPARRRRSFPVFQPTRDLLGRPAFCEAVENEAPQGSVFLNRPLGALRRSSRDTVDFAR
jgi:hypothetical protein